jgi:alpha-glucosidase
MIRTLLSVLFAILFVSASAQSLAPDRCVSFTKNGNEVVFLLANNSRLSLKICSENVVRVWYEPDGNFERNNPSFAVVDEDFGKVGEIHVETQAQTYEIFTSSLRIRVNRDPFSLQIFDKYQKLLLGDYEGGHERYSSGVLARKVLRSDEQFFGLGEKSGGINRRGKVFRMWNSDKPCYGVSEDPLYKSIPFFISSYRYGIFFDNTYKSEFDFGSKSDEYYSFSSPGGELLYYFIQGSDYKEIISRYTQLTGKPIMPPKWAFGFSQSRGLLTKEQLSRDIAKGYRDRNIPCDIIYQDIGWTQYLQDFSWRKETYGNPKQMLADLSKDGFKVIVSQDPVVSQANRRQWREADSLQYFATDVRTQKSYDMPWPWGGNCGVVDFTNPQAAAWWGALQQQPVNDGIKGFWTDMGEPAWSNEESTDRLHMKHHAGMHDEIHNVYGFSWDKVVTEEFEKRNPDTRIFQMTRAGYAGLQRYTFGWSGDAGNGSNALDGWGRLANQVQMAQSAGLGLIPFWSCDISGYCGDIKDHNEMAELYVRWLQFGVFNPISRAHHEGNNAVEPWLFGEEAERLSKKAIELKYRLFPYLYKYGREAYDTGLPLIRAMMLEYPDDPEAVSAEFQFMLGSELLVAPVVEEGASSKRIYLPKGEWILFDEGVTKFKGGQWIELPVSLETIPLFVKTGSIIPTMPVMQFMHAKENYPITLNVFPKAAGKSMFSLYEDDGISNGYKRNEGVRTLVMIENSPDKVTCTLEGNCSSGYKAVSRNLLVRIPSERKPSTVAVDGVKLRMTTGEKLMASVDTAFDDFQWTYDKLQKQVVVRVPATHEKTVMQIEN